MNFTAYTSLADAYMATLAMLDEHGEKTEPISDPTSVGSFFVDRRRTTIEVIGAGFKLENPRDRIVQSRVQPFDMRFAVANVLWTFSGTRSLKPIEHYNPRGRLFSADGSILEGAMGARIFGGDESQFDQVLQLLTEHPASRRAMVQIFMPVDLQGRPRDTPCVAGLHYFIREGRLHSVTFMRSQNAVRLLHYDAFLFSMAQEYLASQLGVELGTYSHMVSSLHYYDDESRLVAEILDAPCFSPGPMGEMPRMTKDDLASIQAVEENMRLRGIAPSKKDMSDYWYQLLFPACSELGVWRRHESSRFGLSDMKSQESFLPGLGPFEGWFASKPERVLEAFVVIRRMALAGDLGGERMPEDSNPGLEEDSAENYHFFTLPMALNFQRNSYRLWEAALETFNDAETSWVFFPREVNGRKEGELRDSLVKHKLAIQPNRHTMIWYKISASLVVGYGGDVRRLFSSTDYDAEEILDIVRRKERENFPYLSGPKICNYWLHVIEQYTDASLKNRGAISVAPDTHVIQASIRLGLVQPSQRSSPKIQQMVNEAWSAVISKTHLDLIDVHSPLWLWSKSRFWKWEVVREVLKS